MFEIGLDEILIVLIVAFIVLKPEDLFKTIKTAGRLIAKMQRIWRETKNEIESNINKD